MLLARFPLRQMHVRVRRVHLVPGTVGAMRPLKLRVSSRLIPVAVLAGSLAAAAPATAQSPAPGTVIPAGVSVAGVDLSGTDAAGATSALEAARGNMERTITVRFGERSHKLPASRAGYSVDIPATVSAALSAQAPGAITPVVKFDRKKVREFVKGVAKREYRAPRDARLKITPSAVRTHPHRVGLRVYVNPLAAEIEKALKDPVLTRFMQPKRTKLAAQVTRGTLIKQHPTILTVNRSTFKLRLWKNLRWSKTYKIAVGAAGHDTPRGTYKITNKAVNPAWHVPNSAWAGSLAGSVIPGGAPNNPLKARWLGIVNGVGIHGTAEEWSIGTRASKGCLRMRVKDVVDLYPRVPVGTTVLIH